MLPDRTNYNAQVILKEIRNQSVFVWLHTIRLRSFFMDARLSWAHYYLQAQIE